MATAEKFSAKEAAIQLGTDARTLRKFLRSSPDFDSVGQGNRYEFTSKDIKALKKKFAAPTKKAPAKVNGKKITDEVIDADIEAQDEIDRTIEEVDLDDDGEVVTLDDLDPSDDDLEEIDLEDDDI
jgi:enolase